ncbi:hypothetical protein L3X38_020752 [Prunus dulcis]|uniref:Uncharacterized protein n=1 Tax=Prunus dulcis TaxID=3755 RepID=A0AAD4WDH6_PRUDU|nr:hypothetical protein L3X38_020752 [Prunus dulcis]
MVNCRSNLCCPLCLSVDGKGRKGSSSPARIPFAFRLKIELLLAQVGDLKNRFCVVLGSPIISDLSF